MSTIDGQVTLHPVFCHRDDCDARRDRDFCATCGADIAAYLKTVTDEHAPVTPERPTAVMAFPVLTSVDAGPRLVAPANVAAGEPLPNGAAIEADVPERPSRALWREPLVAVSFGVALALGAAAGVLANLA
jgi:hypothetical protein